MQISLADFENIDIFRSDFNAKRDRGSVGTVQNNAVKSSFSVVPVKVVSLLH
jgi:hypothetical protein